LELTLIVQPGRNRHHRVSAALAMNYRWLGCCVLAAAPLIAVQAEPGAPAQGSLLGYSAQGAALESEWERKFQDGKADRSRARIHG
jgi:hypothetical protein